MAFDVGIATGAGIPSSTDIARYKASGAKVLRCSAVNWTQNNGGGTSSSFVASATRNQIDAFVKACNTAGIKLILGVNGGNNSSGNGGAGMNTYSVQFAAFCVNVAARYVHGSVNGEIECLEAGNEPNRSLWDSTFDPAEYAHLMSLIYPGVVALGANRPLVMIGGIAGDPSSGPSGMSCAEWTTGLYAASPSIKGNYDVWNTHRYTFPYTPSENIANGTMRGWLAATVGKAGLPGSQKIRGLNSDATKPHAVTEYGIPEPFPGLWTNKTDYTNGDSATFNGIVYDCILTHSHTTPHQPPNATYWTPSARPFENAARWIAAADDAITLYAAEPGACYFCYFTDYDKKLATTTSGAEKSDGSNWHGLWLVPDTFPLGFSPGSGIPTHDEFTAMKAAGASYVRMDVHWNAVDTNQDGTLDNTTALDAAITYCNSIGLDIWLLANGSSVDDMNIASLAAPFAKYLANLAAHLNGVTRVIGIEVGNEVNAGPWGQRQPPYDIYRGQAYAQIMIRLFDVSFENVRTRTDRPIYAGSCARSDPLTHIMESHGRGLNTKSTGDGQGPYVTVDRGLPTEKTFIDGMRGHYDGICLHPYDDPNFASNWSTRQNGGTYELTRVMDWLLATFGDVPKLAITEYGYTTYDPAGSDTAAKLAAEGEAITDAVSTYAGLAAARGWTIAVFCWFSFMDKPPSNWVSGHAYSVGDLVIDAAVTYQCNHDHTSSSLNRPPNASFWDASDDKAFHWGIVRTTATFPIPDASKKQPAYDVFGYAQTVEKPVVLDEFRRLTTWRPSTGPYVNKPSDWSSQDLGWAIPNADFHWAANTAGRNRMKRVLDRIVASKSKLLRTECYWASFQSTQSDVRVGWADTLNNTTFLDELMDACESRGIYVVFTHTYTPGWARAGGTDHAAPIHPEDYANAAWCVADRYQTRNPGTLIMFEWWNEPNISNFWQDPSNPKPGGAGNGPHVGHYTACMIAASRVIRTGVLDTPTGQRVRTAHAEIMVANGGLSPASGTGANGSNYSPLHFVEGIIAAGGASYMDAFIDHTYMWLCPAEEVVAWNPFVQLSGCLSALKAAAGPLDAWCTEGGIISRPDVSGTDPNSYDCGAEPGGIGGPAGGYDGTPGHVAPGGGTYNTSDRAVDYTTSADRVKSYVKMWRSPRFYDTDPNVNRLVTGPFFVFRLNDQAIPTDWGFDEDHYGAYEYGTDSTDGPAKPFANEWFKRFSNSGGPNSGTDSVPPTTHIISIDGTNMEGGGAGGLPFPMGLALGAGIPTNAELDRAKALGAAFVRCGVGWDNGSSAPDHNFDKPTAIAAAVKHANDIGLGFVLQVGSGPTYNGSMYTHDFNGVDVLTEYSGFAANVARYFDGLPGTDKYVWAVEILNECNHAKINDPELSPGVPNPHFIPWVHDASYPTGPTGPDRYMEMFIRIVHPDWENAPAHPNCPPIITTGLGGEHDSKGLPSYDFTVAVHQTVTFGGHTYTGGLWEPGQPALYAAYNLHPYTRPKLPSQDTAGGGFDSMRQTMAWFLANRGSLPPFYITEFGQPTLPESTATLQYAADAMTDAISLLTGYIENNGWNLLGFAWFTMLNNNKPNLPPGAGDNDMGILHYNADPMAATPKSIECDKYVEFATTGPSDPPTPTVSGSAVPIVIAAADDVAVARVDLLLDGATVGTASFTSPDYEFSWDSTATTNGGHALRSRATDRAGNITTSIVANVTVANSIGADPDPPTVTLIGISDGDMLSGPAAPVTVQAVDVNSAGTPDPNPTTTLRIDGQVYPGIPIRVDSSGNPDPAGTYYKFFVDTIALTNGTHTLRGVSIDADGNTGRSALITFLVDHGPPPFDTPPIVYLTYPNTGATVTGMHAVFNAFAHDDDDPIVPTVELWITETIPFPPGDGAFTLGVSELGGPDVLGGGGATAQSGPGGTVNPIQKLGKFVPTGGDTYLLIWNSLHVPNGDYQVQPRAVDSVLHEVWGPAINITVTNVPVAPNATGVDRRFPWRVYARDGDTWARLAPIEGWDELDLTIVENEVGAWTLKIPNANDAVPYLLRDHSGIVVYKRGTVVFSGDTDLEARKWDTTDRWTFTGSDDMAWIKDEVAHPAPSDAGPDANGFWTTGNDTRGPAAAESLIYAYLNANIGPGAISARRIPNLALGVDQARGAVVGPYAPRFHNLLDVLKIIALAGGGLGFRILTSDRPRFVVYFPADRSGFVRFAAQLNKVTSFSFEYGEPEANVIYSGGKGAGQNRQFVVKEDVASVATWRRRVLVTEHVDSIDLPTLAAAATADLVSNAFVPTLAVEPKDVPNAQFIDDYGLGDLTSVVLPERVAYVDRVVSVALKFTGAEGVIIKPAVGAVPRDALRVMTEARRLRSAVQSLQTSP